MKGGTSHGEASIPRCVAAGHVVQAGRIGSPIPENTTMSGPNDVEFVDVSLEDFDHLQASQNAVAPFPGGAPPAYNVHFIVVDTSVMLDDDDFWLFQTFSEPVASMGAVWVVPRTVLQELDKIKVCMRTYRGRAEVGGGGEGGGGGGGMSVSPINKTEGGEGRR